MKAESTIDRPIARPSRRVLAYVFGLIIAMLWGASFVVTKAALDVLGPFGIAFVRWAISSLALFGWLALRGKMPLALKLVRTDGLRVVWLGLSGITLFYALENLALAYTTATNAGILANMTSVFMVILGVLWFQERLRVMEWLALALAFLGAALVSQGSGHLSIAGPGLRGDLMMVVATLFAAIYSVGSKRLTDRYPPDVVITMISAAGALLLLPFALWEGLTAARALALPAPAWGSLLMLGLGAGALANLWWVDILSYLDASRAGMILFLIPIFSTALAVVFLHEPLTPLALAGAVLVLIGVAVMQRKT